MDRVEACCFNGRSVGHSSQCADGGQLDRHVWCSPAEHASTGFCTPEAKPLEKLLPLYSLLNFNEDSSALLQPSQAAS